MASSVPDRNFDLSSTLQDFAAREVLSFWETPAQQMRGTVDTWFRDTVTRLSSAGLQNSELICEHLLERVSFISFRSFLKGRLVLAKSDIEWLLEKSSEECEINSVDFLNFFFVFNDRGSGEIQFHNEPQQKVLSAFYVSQQMKKSKKLAEIVSIANEKEHQISSSENMRSSDIICMMWVQSCKSFFFTVSFDNTQLKLKCDEKFALSCTKNSCRMHAWIKLLLWTCSGKVETCLKLDYI